MKVDILLILASIISFSSWLSPRFSNNSPSKQNAKTQDGDDTSSAYYSAFFGGREICISFEEESINNHEMISEYGLVDSLIENPKKIQTDFYKKTICITKEAPIVTWSPIDKDEYYSIRKRSKPIDLYDYSKSSLRIAKMLNADVAYLMRKQLKRNNVSNSLENNGPTAVELPEYTNSNAAIDNFLSDSAAKYGSRISPASSPVVEVTDSDLVHIIPKDYFTAPCEIQCIGLEYGFYIQTMTNASHLTSQFLIFTIERDTPFPSLNCTVTISPKIVGFSDTVDGIVKNFRTGSSLVIDEVLVGAQIAKDSEDAADFCDAAFPIFKRHQISCYHHGAFEKSSIQDLQTLNFVTNLAAAFLTPFLPPGPINTALQIIFSGLSLINSIGSLLTSLNIASTDFGYYQGSSLFGSFINPSGQPNEQTPYYCQAWNADYVNPVLATYADQLRFGSFGPAPEGDSSYKHRFLMNTPAEYFTYEYELYYLPCNSSDYYAKSYLANNFRIRISEDNTETNILGQQIGTLDERASLSATTIQVLQQIQQNLEESIDLNAEQTIVLGMSGQPDDTKSFLFTASHTAYFELHYAVIGNGDLPLIDVTNLQNNTAVAFQQETNNYMNSGNYFGRVHLITGITYRITITTYSVANSIGSKIRFFIVHLGTSLLSNWWYSNSASLAAIYDDSSLTWCPFECMVPGRYQIFTAQYDDPVDTFVVIYNKDFERIAFNDDYPNRSLYSELSLYLPAGCYFICVGSSIPLTETAHVKILVARSNNLSETATGLYGSGGIQFTIDLTTNYLFINFVVPSTKTWFILIQTLSGYNHLVFELYDHDLISLNQSTSLEGSFYYHGSLSCGVPYRLRIAHTPTYSANAETHLAMVIF